MVNYFTKLNRLFDGEKVHIRQERCGLGINRSSCWTFDISKPLQTASTTKQTQIQWKQTAVYIFRKQVRSCLPARSDCTKIPKQYVKQK